MWAEFSARIAFQENILRRWSPVGGRPTSIEATARTHSGGAWFDIAVCRLLLGDANSARDAFGRAAELMYSALEVMSPPSLATYCAALESAVLSGDRALADRIATNAVDPEPRPSLIGDRLEWALALPALVTGDDARASQHARRATTAPDKAAWYPGLGDAIVAVARQSRPRAGPRPCAREARRVCAGEEVVVLQRRTLPAVRACRGPPEDRGSATTARRRSPRAPREDPPRVDPLEHYARCEGRYQR
jgi:hypothetical protein